MATFSRLESPVGDISRLPRVAAPTGDGGDGYFGLLPIPADKLRLYLICVQIAILSAGSIDSRADVAASLVSLA